MVKKHPQHKFTFTTDKSLANEFIKIIERQNDREIGRGDVSAALRHALALYIQNSGAPLPEGAFEQRLNLLKVRLQNAPEELSLNSTINMIKDSLGLYDKRTIAKYLKELNRKNYLSESGFNYKYSDFVFNNLISRGGDLTLLDDTPTENKTDPQIEKKVKNQLKKYRGKDD